MNSNKNYSYVDICLSILIIVSSFLVPKISLTKDDTSFMQTVIKLILCSSTFYAIGNIASSIYLKWKQTKPRINWDFLKYFNIFLYLVPALIVIGAIYSITISIQGLYISVIFSMIAGWYLGFSVGNSYRVSHFELLDNNEKIRACYEHPYLTLLPYIILFYLIVFPCEYFIINKNTGEYHNVIILIMFISGYLGILYKYGDSDVLVNIRIKHNDLISRIIYSIMILISMMGLQCWDINVQNMIRETELTYTFKIALLFFTGVLPLRIIPIFVEKHEIKPIALNIISIGIYAYLKIR